MDTVVSAHCYWGSWDSSKRRWTNWSSHGWDYDYDAQACIR